MDAALIELECAGCSKRRPVKPTPKGEPRTPMGWKHKGSEHWCGDCWREKYVLRAIAFPVSSPMDATWEELRSAVKTMWQQTTRCLNWMMTELYTRDVKRDGQAKLPVMPRVYLYPEARVLFPELPSQTVASLEQSCQRKYRARRLEVIWRHSAALPTHRYPTPFPVHNQSWEPSIEAQKPIVSVRIAERRYRLRLRGGPKFWRQQEAFDLMVAGKATTGEAAIYQKGTDLMVKLVAWLPRSAPRRDSQGQPLTKQGVLTVRSATDALIRAVNHKDETLWIYNADQIRRWSAEHQRQLQRWSEDQKYEQRPEPSFAQRREDAARKYRNRMNSACHMIAVHIAGYASRRRFAVVKYNDAERAFCSQFPWATLKRLLAEKLDAAHIKVEASGPVDAETAEPLAEPANDEN